jgi:hypothetical protein
MTLNTVDRFVFLLQHFHQLFLSFFARFVHHDSNSQVLEALTFTNLLQRYGVLSYSLEIRGRSNLRTKSWIDSYMELTYFYSLGPIDGVHPDASVILEPALRMADLLLFRWFMICKLLVILIYVHVTSFTYVLFWSNKYEGMCAGNVWIRRSN